MAIFRLEIDKTIVMLDFSTFNLSKCDISCKKTFLNVGPKLSYLGIFGLELEKATVLWYFTSASSNFSKDKLFSKNKNPDFLKCWTKIALIGYFGLELQKTNVVFEISILEFVNIQSFIQKQKNLGIFGLQFDKNYYQVFNQSPRICLIQKFQEKTKIARFGTQNA